MRSSMNVYYRRKLLGPVYFHKLIRAIDSSPLYSAFFLIMLFISEHIPQYSLNKIFFSDKKYIFSGKINNNNQI